MEEDKTEEIALSIDFLVDIVKFILLFWIGMYVGFLCGITLVYVILVLYNQCNI